MKRKLLQAVCLVLTLVSCISGNKPYPEENIIVDIAEAMENPTKLKASDLVKEMHYIPLETTDSCLIGNNPKIKILENKIMVTTNKQCLLFDKQNGQFLCQVGHLGNDPKAYSSTENWIDNKTGAIYFLRHPNQLIKYNQQGEMTGQVTIPIPPVAPESFAFTDSLIVGHYSNITMGCNTRSLLFFDESGNQRDTVASLLPALPEIEINDIESMTIKKLGNSAVILTFSKKGNTATISTPTFLWKYNGEIRFKESFVDTAYTLKGSHLEPYLIFNTGKWHWDAEARTNGEDNEKKLLVSFVLENDSTVFFECINGLYTNKPQTYSGIYSKTSHTTRIGNRESALTDDITGFLPFHPSTCSQQGEYGSIIESADALSWLEENQGTVTCGKLNFLKQINEDSNPIVRIAK